MTAVLSALEERLEDPTAKGLAHAVSAAVRDRFLSIIEQRCLLGVNGASWQTECVARLEARGLTRDKALREMLRHYIEGMMANEPVHTWELPKA